MTTPQPTARRPAAADLAHRGTCRTSAAADGGGAPPEGELIPLSAVPKLELMPRRAGKTLHVSTLYRWAARGIRGIVLHTVQVGGVRCTTVPRLLAFFESVRPTSLDKAAAMPGDSPQAVEAALRELRRMLSRDATCAPGRGGKGGAS